MTEMYAGGCAIKKRKARAQFMGEQTNTQYYQQRPTSLWRGHNILFLSIHTNTNGWKAESRATNEQQKKVHLHV